jgi:hypothetical protein
VLVRGASILLGEDGRYTFKLQTTMGDPAPVESRQSRGSYHVEGDTLFLDMDDDGMEPVPLTYSLEDGRLTLRVPAGYAYTFQRQ